MALQQVARVGLPARLPSGFRCHVGMAPTSAAGSVPGDTLPPASPRALPPCWGEARELGNPLGSRAGTPTGPTPMAGGRGAAIESTQRARGYGMIQNHVKTWQIAESGSRIVTSLDP